MEDILSYRCNICSNVFHEKTEDLYNGDEELFCSIQCCETYYHTKYLMLENNDEDDEEHQLHKYEELNEEEKSNDDYDGDNSELEERCCENCKEEYVPKYISQKYCCKFCEDSKEENAGYALIRQFSNLNRN